jgi:hypothetical protein
MIRCVDPISKLIPMNVLYLFNTANYRVLSPNSRTENALLLVQVVDMEWVKFVEELLAFNVYLDCNAVIRMGKLPRLLTLLMPLVYALILLLFMLATPLNGKPLL